jgi:hypothetical protein
MASVMLLDMAEAAAILTDETNFCSVIDPIKHFEKLDMLSSRRDDGTRVTLSAWSTRPTWTTTFSTVCNQPSKFVLY